jgi:hypothetical protein
MLKNKSVLEQVIENKVYHFTCDPDSDLKHVKDALVKFLQFVGHIEDQAAAQQKAAQETADAEKVLAPIEEPPKES